ncbi:MAG: hypothetical protein LBD91_02045 [Prevotellaceae bacterium]|jgi:hypothetical protein|nr:hypothetical protein [Prevotellaceae bacterium]
MKRRRHACQQTSLSGLFFLLCLCAPPAVVAQKAGVPALPLDSLMRNVAAETDSARKITAMNDFAAALEDALRQDATMNRSFDSIPHLGILTSKDKKVRIITWNLPLTPARHKYYGIVQYRTNNGIQTTVLQDVKETLATRPESTVLAQGQWFGALYYDILQHKAGKQSRYTLLGYDFHTDITHRKLLESVTFDDTGSPVFGVPLFDNGQWKAGRVLLEYSATSPFYLRYLPHKKMIVYQRMQLEQVAPGQPPAGVPTDIFDGLVLKNGYWLLQKDIPLTANDF